MAGGVPDRRPAEDAPEGEIRRRLIDAIAKAAAEQGYQRLTVEQVSRYAGVSPATFVRHFATKEQGLLAAFDAFLERLWLEVSAACSSADPWPIRVRSALRALLDSVVESSTVARVFTVEAAATSLAVTQRQLAMLDDFAALLRDGRSLFPRAASLPQATERALVGGIASIVAGQLLAEEPGRLTALEPQLVELILIPYVGEEEAKRVAGA